MGYTLLNNLESIRPTTPQRYTFFFCLANGGCFFWKKL